MTEQAAVFQPDWVSPPGDTIADLLEEMGWSQVEFAQRCGFTTKHVSQLINAKVARSLRRPPSNWRGFWEALRGSG